MVRHVPDARLRPAPLSDVLEGGNPTATVGRLVVNGMYVAVAQHHLRVRNLLRDADAVAPSSILRG